MVTAVAFIAVLEHHFRTVNPGKHLYTNLVVYYAVYYADCNTLFSSTIVIPSIIIPT